MSMHLKKYFMIGSSVLFALMVPLTLNLSELSPSADLSDIVRLNEACAQATECKAADDFLCSTHNGNERDYACTQGCNVQRD